MNILIIGQQATGKSVVAQALKEYHEKRNEAVVVFDDSQDVTVSETVAASRLESAKVQVKSTKGKAKAHTIMVMQSGNELMISPRLVDYMIQTSKMR